MSVYESPIGYYITSSTPYSKGTKVSTDTLAEGHARPPRYLTEDGKTIQQEGRDSAAMVGMCFLFSIAFMSGCSIGAGFMALWNR